MKAKLYILLLFLCGSFVANAQLGWRKDSLQFKVATRVYFNQNQKIDSIEVKKIKCDFCSQKQILALEEESRRKARMYTNNPNYRKKRIHQEAHYIRISKDDFKRINDSTFKKIDIVVPEKNKFRGH